MRSHLTGKVVSTEIGNRRPAAIMINNIQAAIPQTGISRADVMYECMVEGSITRMMGLFENYDDLDKIGPVRSARTYFVYTGRRMECRVSAFRTVRLRESVSKPAHHQQLKRREGQRRGRILPHDGQKSPAQRIYQRKGYQDRH